VEQHQSNKGQITQPPAPFQWQNLDGIGIPRNGKPWLYARAHQKTKPNLGAVQIIPMPEDRQKSDAIKKIQPPLIARAGGYFYEKTIVVW
jgi:hypothetical protein